MGWYSVHSRSCLSILGPIPCLLCSTSSHREQTPAGCISQSLISRLLAGFGQWHALVGDGKVGERKMQKYFLSSVPITGFFFSSLGGSSFCPAPIKEATAAPFTKVVPVPELWSHHPWVSLLVLTSELLHLLLFGFSTLPLPKVTASLSLISFCCGHLKWFLTST